jgi:integrase/recombinase XerC
MRGPDVGEHTQETVRGDVVVAVNRIADDLRARRYLTGESEPRVLALFSRFGEFLVRAFGVGSLRDVSGEHVATFVHAKTSTGNEPSVATMRLRRSAVRLLFRTARELDLTSGDPTLDLVLPPRTKEQARPLTDDEVELCRRACLSNLSTTRLSVASALGEATARTAEIPRVRMRDVDLAHSRVWLAGSSKTEPRWGGLTTWGARQVERHLRALGPVEPEALLAYPGRGHGDGRRSFSGKAIHETLQRAGLTDDPYVRPASLTAWAGVAVLRRTARIEAVASALGVRSLDTAAATIDWDWTTNVEPSHG